jgi:transcriptional regulator with XRE-family HTH domain
MFSADRILALRKSKGFSQELLAEQSGVSLRTIQRVEQGETVPRGHTMQALATALGVPLTALQLEAPAHTPAVPEPAVTPIVMVRVPDLPALRSEPQLLQLLNLSALSFLVFPFLNLLVPFLLWRAHRHDTEHVAELGRRVLGFQVLWQVASFFAYLLAALGQAMVNRYYHTVLPGLFLVILFLTYTVNVLVIGYYQLRLRQGDLDVYRIRL